MDPNIEGDRKVIFCKLPEFISFYVCHLCLQCFLTIFQLSYLDTMKCEKVIQHMKRRAQVIPTMVNPSNAPTPVISYISARVIKQLTRPSLLGSP